MNIANQQQNGVIEAQSEQKPVQYMAPWAEVGSNQEGYIIRAELPGVDKSGLEITVDDGELTILGRRKAREASGESLHRESRGCDFRRVYELDQAIDPARIAARLDQGVLTLTLPKAESVKPRKITVD